MAAAGCSCRDTERAREIGAADTRLEITSRARDGNERYGSSHSRVRSATGASGASSGIQCPHTVESLIPPIGVHVLLAVAHWSSARYLSLLLQIPSVGTRQCGQRRQTAGK